MFYNKFPAILSHYLCLQISLLCVEHAINWKTLNFYKTILLFHLSLNIDNRCIMKRFLYTFCHFTWPVPRPVLEPILMVYFIPFLIRKFSLMPMGLITFCNLRHSNPVTPPPIDMSEIVWHTCLQRHLEESTPSPQQLKSRSSD